MHELPFHQLLAAQVALEMADRRLGEAPRVFAPVVDGAAIPRHLFDPEAPAESADVPLLVGTTLDERAYRMADFDVDEAGLLAWAREARGPGRGRTWWRCTATRTRRPRRSCCKARIDTDMTFRRAAHAQADRKAAAGPASVFSYLWSIASPAWGGRYGALPRGRHRPEPARHPARAQRPGRRAGAARRPAGLGVGGVRRHG